jgi:NAD+ kinase
MDIALYGTLIKPEHMPVVRGLLEVLREKKAGVFLYRQLAQYLCDVAGWKEEYPVFDFAEELPVKTIALISLGGDGTTLRAAMLAGKSGIPIMGVNLGRLGFLASIPQESVAERIAQLFTRDYTIEKRSLLQALIPGKLSENQSFALNDLTVTKKDSSSMIRIHTWVNDEFFNVYWADGLIISTPTGSTGYSLSCGGPIILPQSPSIVLTPIAPHNLNVRPVVIPDTAEIKIVTETRQGEFMLSLDSRAYSMPNATEMIIKKAEHPVHFIRLAGTSFMDSLRSKLLWGHDKRN